ncbi:MAG: TPM domain-containing protein [Burkholderiales bacterium]|nr:TPM domain-containing protein [Burkholderiales bacterium]
MKTRFLLAIWLAILGAFAHAATEIPAFTPNVVDPQAYLTEEEKNEVNRLIQDVRARADIHAAVYLLPSLGDESIEALAERAFRKWTLGQAGKDNGLLIVLAMGDRKMRIETGYGLEGDIPDAVAKRILDEQLRPFLRMNQIKNGLASALVALAQKRNKEYVPGAEFQAPALPAVETPHEEPIDLTRGFIWWGVFALMVLGVHPLWARSVGRRKMQLIAADPKLDTSVSLKPSERSLFKAFTAGWFIKLFLIVNPGIFIFLFAMSRVSGVIDAVLDISFAVGVPAFLGFIYWRANRKYASLDAFREYLADEAARYEARMKRLVAIGHAALEPDGRYAFTEAYYESERSRAESNSSSSGSSSSSSGGGSSGGGGASSSW